MGNIKSVYNALKHFNINQNYDELMKPLGQLGTTAFDQLKNTPLPKRSSKVSQTKEPAQIITPNLSTGLENETKTLII